MKHVKLPKVTNVFTRIAAFIMFAAITAFLLPQASFAQLSGPGPVDKVSPELRGAIQASSNPGQLVSVILQLNGAASARLNALLSRNAQVRAQFASFNMMALDLPQAAIDLMRIADLDHMEHHPGIALRTAAYNQEPGSLSRNDQRRPGKLVRRDSRWR